MSPRQMRYQAALRPDCRDTYGNRAFEASPKICLMRTNGKFGAVLQTLAGQVPPKTPPHVLESFMAKGEPK